MSGHDVLRERYRTELRRHSLAGAGNDTGFVIGLFIGIFVPPGLLVVLGQGHLGTGTIVLGMIALGAAGFGAAFVVPMLLASARASRRLRRLETIGRGFDPAPYLEQLAENRATSVVVVRLTGARDVPVATVRAWMPAIAKAAWDGDTLRVESAELATIKGYLAGRSRGTEVATHEFDNRAIDAWFGELVEKVVPKLDGLSAIAVTISGDVEPWDATA